MYCHYMWFILLHTLLSSASCQTEIACRNEAGKPVDWFIIYKLPKYEIGHDGTGLDYMYLDSSVTSWQFGRYLVNTTEGALGSTLEQLYKGVGQQTNNSAYVLYNDAPPSLRYLRHYGHTKGALLFDRSQGFWLVHSVPHFPPFPEKGYSWPHSGKQNAQTVMCVTYKYEQFPQIAQQLLHYNPRVYNCSLPKIFQPEMANLSLLCEGSRLPWISKTKMVRLISANGESFLSFAKSRFYVDDIYTGWVAQALKTTLLTETWQNNGEELPSNCSLPKHVLNVKRIKLPGPVAFKSRYDHSKWCVSKMPEDQWTCLGDLNREEKQMWKSGGLVCSQNLVIYQAFRHAVSWYDNC